MRPAMMSKWLFLFVGTLAAATALAQVFPAKPIKLVIGFPATGSSDIVARLIATHSQKRLGQPVIVENRPGANGVLAAYAVIKAAPDGYTLFFGDSTVFNPLFLKDNGVDTPKELAPVGITLASPWYFFVRGDLPVNSVRDLVAYAKANPGKLTFGAATSTNSLVMQVLESRVGITSLKVPYKGAAPIITAMLAGEVDMSAALVSTYLPHIQSGKLRGLVSTKRSSLLLDLPSASDLGIANFEVEATFSFWAPRGTPDPVIRKLSAETATAAKSADIAEDLRKMDLRPIGSTPEEALRIHDAAIRFWAEAVRLANFKPE